jgi:hypothetical protein
MMAQEVKQSHRAPEAIKNSEYQSENTRTCSLGRLSYNLRLGGQDHDDVVCFVPLKIVGLGRIVCLPDC